MALWREALLARAVLRGKTRGYRHHPQLARFRTHRFPRSAINAYLAAVYTEAKKRGYAFDVNKIGPLRPVSSLSVTAPQVELEWRHLLRKLARRDPGRRRQLRAIRRPRCHPLFRRVKGEIEPWERQL